MAKRFSEYRIKTKDDIGDPDFWNKRFRDLDNRLAGLEDGLASVDEVGQRVEETALQRVDNVITPLAAEAINRLRAITRIFEASSDSTATIGLGAKTFLVGSTERNTFAHLGYVTAVVNDGGPSLRGMTGRVVSYDAASGELVMDATITFGSGTASLWRLSTTAPLDVHVGRTDNPHATTAEQVGAYTTEEVDDLLAGKADAVATADALALRPLADDVADALLGKANAADVFAKTETYDRAAVDIRRLARNRIVNGAMMVSQERGSASVDCSTSTTYVIDQWLASLSINPGGTLRVQQVAVPTPGGSPNRLRCTVQTADTSIAAGDFYIISQPIEGLSLGDARLGSPAARPLIVSFGFRSSIPGTFGFRFSNLGGSRSWVGQFTVAAGQVNTDLAVTFAIPGEQTGTWMTDTSLGANLAITLAAGSTFQGVQGWQSANMVTTAAQTNFMGTAGATFDLFDVGLYVDSLGTGVAPRWQLPAFDDEFRRCQRYYQRVSWTMSSWVGAANQDIYMRVIFPVSLRTTPSLTRSDVVLSNATLPIAGSPNPASLNDIARSVASGGMFAEYIATLSARF